MTKRGPNLTSLPKSHGTSKAVGAKAPNPTHVNASSPQGVPVNPNNRGGTTTRNDWYKGDELIQYAIDKD